VRVFVIGASGYIGGAIAREIGWAGYQVLGLARSQEAAHRLENRGIEVLRGNLEDPEGVAAVAREAEATVYAASADTATAVSAAEAIAGTLEGSGKAFVTITGAMIYGDTGQELVSEDSPLNPRPVSRGS
jgi:uncharacterized protein YbjT (DUF2867 family)